MKRKAIITGMGKAKSFRDELAELSTADPEFYDYLRREQADLLEEKEEEEVSIQGSDEMDETALPARTEATKKPTNLIEAEDGPLEITVEAGSGFNLADARLVKQLMPILKNPAHHKKHLHAAITTASRCLRACLERLERMEVVKQGEQSTEHSGFIVKTEKVSNRIIKLCTRFIPDCLIILLRPLGRRNGTASPASYNLATARFKHWHRHGALVRNYLDLHLKLVIALKAREATTPTISDTLRLVPLFLHSKRLCRELIKLMGAYWGQRDNAVRRASAAVLCKIAQSSNEIFPIVYKACYRAYISIVKIVDAESFPLLVQMRISFAQISQCNAAYAYRQASTYLQQLAVVLRGAVVAKKKDLVKSVYNWQFIRTLQLWTVVLIRVKKGSSSGGATPFDAMCHPLVELITITLRLFPSPRYLPLRIHCVRMLLKIQVSMHVYIPCLAAAIDLLDELAALDAKKPIPSQGVQKLKALEEILVLKRAHVDDAAVRLQLATQLCQLIEEVAKHVGRQPAYPCLMLPVDEKLKMFLKECQCWEHVQMVKGLRKKLSGVHESS